MLNQHEEWEIEAELCRAEVAREKAAIDPDVVRKLLKPPATTRLERQLDEARREIRDLRERLKQMKAQSGTLAEAKVRIQVLEGRLRKAGAL